MTATQFISKEKSPRREILGTIHQLILDQDKKVEPEVSKMMGQEMLIYKCNGMMKYALASGKNHMSLHLLPMYGSVKIHAKYKKLLARAKFQKGCINFTKEEEMPVQVLEGLLKDCSEIDLSVFFNKKPGEKKASKEWMDYHKK